MKMKLAAAGALLLLVGAPASAHRLDEYLQATTFSLGKDRVQALVRLTPGVAVFRQVIPVIDSDGDRVISEDEQQAYAARVLRDFSLTIDGERMELRLLSFKFATIDEMKEGLGVIELLFSADVPRGESPSHRLIFENHHRRAIAAFLVNCLAPRDPDIRIKAQKRNNRQSYYRLDYTQRGASKD
jgi:hypothetical protein